MGCGVSDMCMYVYLCVVCMHGWGWSVRVAHSTYTYCTCVTGCITYIFHIRTSVTCHRSPVCMSHATLYDINHLALLTLFTANSAPLKYTMLMVPLPPFPILLSTASREGRGRKDPISKAAMLCVGEAC